MMMSQYDYKMYQSELESLRDEMTDILIEMELRHGDGPAAFEEWWNGEGHMRHYFDLKGRAEQVEQTLAYAEIEVEERPRMRAPAASGAAHRFRRQKDMPKD